MLKRLLCFIILISFHIPEALCNPLVDLEYSQYLWRIQAEPIGIFKKVPVHLKEEEALFEKDLEGIIKITPQPDINVAALSLVYELSNVIHAAHYDAVREEAKLCEISAEEYAERMLELEARAVFSRSVVATELGLKNLLLNQIYLEIATNTELSSMARIGLIHKEMIKSATVASKKIPAFSYYVQQFHKLLGKNCAQSEQKVKRKRGKRRNVKF